MMAMVGNEDKKLLIFKYAIAFVLFVIFVIFILNLEKQSKIEEHLEQKANRTVSNYKALYNKYKAFATVVYKTEINRDEVIDIFKEAYRSDEQTKKNLRGKLYKRLIKAYELLKENNIRQLHFHLPDNESFLRFHRPGKFGDNLSGIRSTVEYVNKNKKPIDGFEEGRIFNGYRFVYPLFDQEQNHIGSVEVSFSSLAFHIEYLSDYHLASNFLILKEIVDKKVFSEEKSNYIKSPFSNFYFEKTIFRHLQKHIGSHKHESNPEVINEIESRVLKGDTYSIYDLESNVIKTYIPVRNPISGKVAAIYVSIDEASYIKNKTKNYFAIVFTVVLLLTVVFYFMYKNSLSSCAQKKLIKELSTQAKELEEYKRVLDESDIVSKADLKGNITYVNKKFENITGYSKDELMGKPHSFVRHGDVPKELFKDMWNKIRDKETFKGIIKNRKKDGSSYYVDATIVPILDVEGNIKEYIGVRHDITDIMNPKRQFLDDLSTSKEPIAVLGKIKNYRLLKEFYGESFIQKVEDFITTNILSLVPKESPLSKVYHLDNGEYAFLRESGNASASEIEQCLENFKKNITSHKFVLDDKKIDIDFYFAFTTQKENAFENIKIAIEKARKENMDIIFSDNFASKQKMSAHNNMEMVDILKSVINNTSGARIISYFQAVQNNNTGEIEKYESLVRLVTEEGSVISPFFFLDIAKKAGYYNDITNFVLENSFKALDQTDKEITINLSTMDIENIDIRNKLLELTTGEKYYGRVVFELLEDEVAKDFETIKEFISLVKTKGGVKIAIDDFGSGYSNFERLLDFQPDILKIDGSLIKNIVSDPFSQHVVEAIVLFAKKENIKTVAEFVADEEILSKVKSMGIDYSQGFHIAKPEPFE